MELQNRILVHSYFLFTPYFFVLKSRLNITLPEVCPRRHEYTLQEHIRKEILKFGEISTNQYIKLPDLM